MSLRRFTISPPTTIAFPLPIIGWHRGTPNLHDFKVTGSGPAGWPSHGAPHVVAAIVSVSAAAASGFVA
jgi:hypothetical protein